MDRLIELLNNYLIEKDISIYTFYWNQAFNCIHRFNGERCDNERICSKSFGFIKRLVDNNKIDLWKIKKLYRKSNENSTHTYPIMYEYSDSENLLMALSISDTPIDDLILYLN